MVTTVHFEAFHAEWWWQGERERGREGERERGREGERERGREGERERGREGERERGRVWVCIYVLQNCEYEIRSQVILCFAVRAI